MSAVRINSNPAYSRAISDFSQVDREGRTHRGRLAPCMRINTGQDDVGFLSVSEGMRAEIGRHDRGNPQRGKGHRPPTNRSGRHGEISNMLIRMRELATESTNDTFNDRNRESLDAEFNQLKEYVDRIAKLAKYNDKSLLLGFGSEVDQVLFSASRR